MLSMSHWTGACVQELPHPRVDRDGSFANVVLPETVLWKTSPTIPPELACVQEPLGNAVDAALVEDLTGQTVLITGCGPTGLFAAAVARTAGAAMIIATDVSAYRLDLAKQVGVDHLLDAKTETADQIAAAIGEITAGEGVDASLEMSNLRHCITQCRKERRTRDTLRHSNRPDQLRSRE
jgi:threonine 3-dehydrogenase